MLRNFISLAFLVASWGSVAAEEPKILKLFAVGDQEIMLRRGISVDRDCSPLKPTRVATIVAPKNGTLTERTIQDFPNYDKENARFLCNEKRVDAVAAFYKARPGFKGKDIFEFAIVYYDGEANRYKIEIMVW